MGRCLRAGLAGGLLAILLAGCTAGTEPAQTPSSTPTTSGSTAPASGQPTSPGGGGGGGSPTGLAPVNTPTPGNIDQTVEAKPQTTAKPVELESPYVAPEVEVTLRSIRRIQMKGMGPGEISGPALRIAIQVRNRTHSPISVDSAIVNLTDSKGRVGTPYAGSPARPLVGTIDAGGRASGVYVFSVAKKARTPITVAVTYTPGAETALFVGDAA